MAKQIPTLRGEDCQEEQGAGQNVVHSQSFPDNHYILSVAADAGYPFLKLPPKLQILNFAFLIPGEVQPCASCLGT